MDDMINVGVGGWAYLPIKRGNKLGICSQLYDFVEVNSTFYNIPALDRVKTWRSTVKDDFEFTVKANRELTHVGNLQATKKNLRIFEVMSEICKILDSSILHFQFPPSFNPTDQVVSGMMDFFSSTQRRGFRFAIETRNPSLSNSKAFQNLLGEFDIIPATDASRVDGIAVSPDSKILYTRVFGPGQHTKWSFDSQELKDLAKKVIDTPARKRYVTFHNLTMYEDASRLKTVIKQGNDQRASPLAPLGINSLKRVLASGRLLYPVTKQTLIEEFGWKTFHAEPDRKMHVEKALERLPDNSGRTRYQSVEEVIQTLEQGEPFLEI